MQPAIIAAIVVVMVAFLTYRPFAADGFALITLSTSACAFASRRSLANDTLPIGAWTMPPASLITLRGPPRRRVELA